MDLTKEQLRKIIDNVLPPKSVRCKECAGWGDVAAGKRKCQRCSGSGVEDMVINNI